MAVRSGGSQNGKQISVGILSLGLLVGLSSGFAQVQDLSTQSQSAPAQMGAAPLTITLQDALQRARLNDPQYRSAAVTDLGLAREDRVQARAALLPNVNYVNSFIYTQGTGAVPVNCVNTAVGCPT